MNQKEFQLLKQKETTFSSQEDPNVEGKWILPFSATVIHYICFPFFFKKSSGRKDSLKGAKKIAIID
uniref:Uncharacterized protein n=1 Tax=Arundo donax TaxID=35708 RepID=A0A0A8XUQ9_ARUDO